MKVLIVGASGSLAPYVIEALSDKAELILFVRNKRKLSSSKHKVIEGDATNYDDVKNAMEGIDLVYVNLAGDLETMTGNIVRAMQETGVKRIIAISSIGIYESPLRSILRPYRKLADIIEASGLDYTVLRPDWFTSTDEIDYAITHKGEPETGSAVSRKSIAAFVAEIVGNPELYKNENIGISKL
jgi:uncharacterized protein YbjT (DUF2867 family)